MIVYPEAILSDLSKIIAMAALAIIVWGVCVCLSTWAYLGIFRRGTEASILRENARRALGTYILLGLEVLIVADIIETVINPALEEIAILGAIVSIRTVISFFLDREIRADEEKHTQE